MKQLQGIFIEFEESQLAALWEFLEDIGYEKTGQGIKDCLLDLMKDSTERKEDPAETVAGQINDFLHENPQIVGSAMHLGNILSSLARAKFRI
jgi:hypothetical protein